MQQGDQLLREIQHLRGLTVIFVYYRLSVISRFSPGIVAVTAKSQCGDTYWFCPLSPRGRELGRGVVDCETPLDVNATPPLPQPLPHAGGGELTETLLLCA